MFKDPKDDPRDAYYARWVEVRASPIHGHGVFATRDIAKDRIIEVSPAIVYSEALHKEGRELASYLGSAPHAVHVLEAYAFSWDKCGMVAIGMGWTGIYNHSFEPNVTVNRQYADKRPGTELQALVVSTIRDVKEGEELCHMYSRFEDGLPFDVEEGSSPWTLSLIHI